MNEQRVFKNNGKRFEEDFKASFGAHMWTYRPPDTGGGQLARFTSESLCDLMVYNTKNKSFALMELKSTLGTSVSFKPYDFCNQYESSTEKFNQWLGSLTPKERKLFKDEISTKRKNLKQLYKQTNQAMIKYHQIKSLLEAKELYKIETYIVFTFFKTNGTYALPIKSFVEFWKITEKKSINECDLKLLTKVDKAYSVNQQYIGRSMKSKYDVDLLV